MRFLVRAGRSEFSSELHVADDLAKKLGRFRGEFRRMWNSAQKTLILISSTWGGESKVLKLRASGLRRVPGFIYFLDTTALSRVTKVMSIRI